MKFISESIVNNPKISVCVPTYNQEKYIAETLDSIVSQTVNVPFEIIIADDCSIDKTKEICLEYQKKYPEKIVLIVNEQNQGLIRNLFDVLFVNARGKYFAICAGDDIWINENKLQKQFDVLEQNNNVSVVHTGYNKFYENQNKYVEIKTWESPLLNKCGVGALKVVILERFSSFPVASSMLFRKSTIDQYKNIYSNIIYDNDAPGEGLILFSFFTLDGYFYFIPDILVNYRIREGSVSHITDKSNELIFKIRYRICQKTIIAETILNDKKLIKRINRSFLSLYYESIKSNSERTFFTFYNDYKIKNGSNIPSYVKSTISFFSLNSFNKLVFTLVISVLLKIKGKTILLKSN